MVEAQAIDTAPRGSGWILGYVPDLEKRAYMPWLALTWGDMGWMDDDGNACSPTLWSPLPDPQPKPTGWRPAEGTIRIEPAKWQDKEGKPVSGIGDHVVYIMRADGTSDDYRDCWPATDFEDAKRRALKWQHQFGLPIVGMEPPTNVVPFRPVSQVE